MKVTAIIPAGGYGKRIGAGIHKQLIEISGKPILIHTLEKFETCKCIDSIIIATAPEILLEVEKLVKEFNITKVVEVTIGGNERQDSVYNALQIMVYHHTEIVVVHDAVRPFITCEKICEVISACKETGAAILAVHPKETIKLGRDDGFVEKTLDRNLLWLVQTPQAFYYTILQQAYKRAYTDSFYGTDDASLVERLGIKVKIVEGLYENIKITTPEDIEFAKMLLSRG
ncbi:MAG: 2-C-methyl-D-erythritol 4-phosphate cytidylyltransferase [Candidatus Kryptonium sp.]|nr:2-C-methyl-D-erythritol 4-phosphate cytidylyltransferase [Candidatus Kryptonium sp.]MCX7761999.1 2-C-methyl-D-erythritol 4-phosphate cytidylyltransferase [Candidatus Kryptonium sp.]MDW8108669.1 2-C-methyl-D-erythritol 4-phosphate cytidylyltransferase [Candidatus Kryptonium sp.]